MEKPMEARPPLKKSTGKGVEKAPWGWGEAGEKKSLETSLALYSIFPVLIPAFCNKREQEISHEPAFSFRHHPAGLTRFRQDYAQYTHPVESELWKTQNPENSSFF